MAFRPSSLLSALLALAALLSVHPAFAWVEMQVLSQESRVELRRQGQASIETLIKLRVRGGPLRSFDIKLADRNISLPEGAELVTSGDNLAAKLPVPVRLDQRPDGTLRVDIDGGQGVRRGLYDLQFKYTVDLLQSQAISRDGSMLRVRWMGPAFADGIDNVRCTFAVPASATEPRAVGDIALGAPQDESANGVAGAFLTSLTRLPEFDELTLIRPHVAKDEAVAWTIRVDPKVFGELSDPRLHVNPPVQPSAFMLGASRRALYLVAAGALALAYSILLALKHQQVLRAYRARQVPVRPLVPVGIALRVALAGPLLAAGIAGQTLLPDPMLGSLAVLGAVALTVYRTPLRAFSPRGPGRWLPLSDADAFEQKVQRARGWLDASTRWGRLAFVLSTLALGTLVAWLARHWPYHGYLTALDYVVLVALFGTGRQRELPADPMQSAAPLLRKIAMKLRSAKQLGARVRGIARIPTGATSPDELRLLVTPRSAPVGFVAVEVGIGWAQSSGGPTAFYQVLLRLTEGSPCHQMLTQKLPQQKWLRGREPYERVLVLTPALPLADLTVGLVRRVLALLAPEPQEQTQPRRATSSHARNDSGRSSWTVNAATDSLPLQDTW